MQILQRRSNVQRHMHHFDNVHRIVLGAGSVAEPSSLTKDQGIRSSKGTHVCPVRITSTKAQASVESKITRGQRTARMIMRTAHARSWLTCGVVNACMHARCWCACIRGRIKHRGRPTGWFVPQASSPGLPWHAMESTNNNHRV
eukprot:473687-Pelagomonas_calceolata.AAC.1